MPKTQNLPIPPKGQSRRTQPLIDNGQKPAKRGENGNYPVRGPGGRG